MGNFAVCEETVPNRFLFTGQQYDSLAQQYYLRARFYNPAITRFTQEDTYRGDGLNLYAYCRNNPVCYVDPSGHCSKDPDGEQARDSSQPTTAPRETPSAPSAETPNSNRRTPLDADKQRKYDEARPKGLTVAEACYIAKEHDPLNQVGSDYMAECKTAHYG